MSGTETTHGLDLMIQDGSIQVPTRQLSEGIKEPKSAYSRSLKEVS